MMRPAWMDSSRVILQTAGIYSDASGKAPGWRSAVELQCKFIWCAVCTADRRNLLQENGHRYLADGLQPGVMAGFIGGQKRLLTGEPCGSSDNHQSFRMAFDIEAGFCGKVVWRRSVLHKIK